jgi:exodeoxyribonuclease III
MGDWNSNAIWARERRANLSATVALLADCTLASAYHHYYGCAPGSEQHATWYNHKRAERGFHLDYCFIPQRWLPQVHKVEVGSFEQWRTYNDHCPLIVDLCL